MLTDTPKRPWTILLSLALMTFLIRYRRTALGPLWLIVGPSLFVAVLGLLYSEIGGIDPAVFLPHLAVGLVMWTLVAGFVTNSATIYQRKRAQILQAGLSLREIIIVDVMTIALNFAHQIPIIVVVFLIYRTGLSWMALQALPAIVIVIANGYWVMRCFGILGARYRDLSEVFQAVMRIAFLATPIIWMPGEGVRSGLMGHFLMFNPFYHFIEIVRAPLLGQQAEPLNWGVVLAITLVGFIVTHLFTRRYNRFVPLWV